MNPKRSIEICKQLKIKEIFKEFHEKKLKQRNNARVTSKQQTLAIALSIAKSKCVDVNFTTTYLNQFTNHLTHIMPLVTVYLTPNKNKISQG